jgi:UTP:GlnB (protein PII) uridylyltransferase
MNLPLKLRKSRSRTAGRVVGQVAALSDVHRGQVEVRKQSAARHVEPGSDAATRIESAPPGYLLAHDSGDIARHCQLLSPLPAQGEVRVVVTPGRGPAEWHLDIASRDRPGLLAAFTGVLAERYLDVVQAVVATWDDGAALEAFVIRSASAPDSAALQADFERSLNEPLASSPLFDARVTFDHTASPLYTRCDVRAADRRGLLHSIAVAIAAAGADVHAAGVATTDRVALDCFDLSTPAGHKLTPSLEAAIEANVRNGVSERSSTGRRIRSA